MSEIVKVSTKADWKKLVENLTLKVRDKDACSETHAYIETYFVGEYKTVTCSTNMRLNGTIPVECEPLFIIEEGIPQEVKKQANGYSH